MRPLANFTSAALTNEKSRMCVQVTLLPGSWPACLLLDARTATARHSRFARNMRIHYAKRCPVSFLPISTEADRD